MEELRSRFSFGVAEPYDDDFVSTTQKRAYLVNMRSDVGHRAQQHWFHS